MTTRAKDRTAVTNAVHPIKYGHGFVVLCFVGVISAHTEFKWSILYPYSSGLLHWNEGNRMIAPMPVKQATLKDMGKIAGCSLSLEECGYINDIVSQETVT